MYRKKAKVSLWSEATQKVLQKKQKSVLKEGKMPRWSEATQKKGKMPLSSEATKLEATLKQEF